MIWNKNVNPKYGDQIRVSRGFYCHHAIYVGDSKVVQFGSLNGELDPTKAMIMETSLNDFLKNGVLEVASYNEEELNKKRTPEEIVKYAYSRLGEKGYDLMTNNCEHFSNQCAFGEKKSAQTESIMGLLSKMFR